jgi:hypothetical protein
METIHAVVAKLVRRSRKMEKLSQGDTLRSAWRNKLLEIMTNAHAFMAKHWKNIAAETGKGFDPAILQALHPGADLDITLPCLNAFITEATSRPPNTVLSNFKPTSEYPNFPSTDIPTISATTGECMFFWLAAIESWIEHHLSAWLHVHRQDPGSCGHLRRLMEGYHATAVAAYAGVPVSISVMYLTLLELWVACDTSACFVHPLLKDYDPEIRLSIFESLSLPLKSQMERLHHVESYSQTRLDNAKEQNPSVFCHFGHPSSFAVAYFDQTSSLQALKSEVERVAAVRRDAKCQELVELKKQYRDLMERYNNDTCACTTVTKIHRRRSRKVTQTCVRCKYQMQANDLEIYVYEWPLSVTLPVAKATIFELKLPETFGDWRDASHFIISEVLCFRVEKPGKPKIQYKLDKHHDLSHMIISQYPIRRIIPVSEWKPHYGTHYKSKADIPNLQEADVCLSNGLRYMYYDTNQGIWTAELTANEDLARMCTYGMPQRSKDLERYLYRPPSAPDGLSNNEVIGNLSDCPTHFSSDEFKTFCALPLGQNLVYSNILVQLAMPSVDFAKMETQILIMQIISQAGPSSGHHVERATHRILHQKRFSIALVEKLESALQGVARNWDSWRALATFSQLVRRVLSLTSSREVVGRSLRYLGDVQHICFDWLERLRGRAKTSTNGEQRTELYTRISEIGLLCVSTFDVEDDFLEEVLQQPRAISILLQCCLQIRENHGCIKAENDNLHNIMLQAWRALQYRIFPILQQYVLANNAELNEAISATWTAFQRRPEANWSTVGNAHKHWLHITSGSLPVHFNLLTAELLINGLPLARLPKEYIRHAMYEALFGKCIMDVANTCEPGMSFSAKSSHYGYKLHFAKSGGDMLIVAMGNGFSR